MTDEPTLRLEQEAQLAFCLSKPVTGDFSDPGTGKTPPSCVAIYAFWYLRKQKTIWTMPKSLMSKNRDELLKWSKFKPEEVVIVDGTPAKRLKQIKTPEAKVFIMGFTGFAREWPLVVEHHPEVAALVGDEWHLGFKGPTSQRTESMLNFMAVRGKKLLAMTGTMIDGRLDAAYSFIKAGKPNQYNNIHHFWAVHGIEDQNGRIVAWRNLDVIAKLFKELAVRFTFEQVYGPEAKVLEVIPVDMDPKQREAYEEFEDFALLELEEDWLDGSQPGVNIIRCRQLMEHPQTFGAPLDKIALTGKEQQLEIDLEDHKNTGKPLIIFSSLTAQHDRVAEQCKKMGFKVGIIDGRFSAKHRDKVDKDFRAGKLDIVIASAATAGVGFNWGHVDHIIFMSLDYMDSNFVQAYRRAIRGKRETPVRISVYEYRNSVDQKIFEIVDKKSKLGNDIDDTRERVRLKKARRKEENVADDEVDEAPTGAPFSMEDL